MKKNLIIKRVELVILLCAYLFCLSSCEKEDGNTPSNSDNVYIGYVSSVQDIDGEFHLDSDGDGNLDGFATCINSSMETEINNHINQYAWIEHPYVKVNAKLIDAPNFKYQITKILEKGTGGY